MAMASRKDDWPGEGTKSRAGPALALNSGTLKHFKKSMIPFAPEGSFYLQKLPAYRQAQS
jgi:hypothetical protein